jgi:predicted RNase H-like HicB family nuclease
MKTFTAVIHQEGALYVASCPEAGTTSQGETMEEALKNLQEATELYLEEFPVNDTGRSVVTTFDVAHA